MNNKNYIFGYGSLVNFDQLRGYANLKESDRDRVVYCSLRNYRRSWNVAMDNNKDIERYKYYLDKEDGNRPDVFVCFLNIYEAAEESINGVVFPVSEEMIPSLDNREKNYKRIDITEAVDRNFDGRVWAYIGLEEALDRYKKGAEERKAVISKDYFNLVYKAFESQGNDYIQKYLDSTDNLNIPLKDIKVVKI